MVRQHAEEPKKFVVLTSHGVQIFVKLRPVDILKQILKDSHGQDTEALKTFFLIQKEDQACAAALILASLETEDDIEIAEFATRAFFLFGGEPKLAPLPGSNMCMYIYYFSCFDLKTSSKFFHYKSSQSYRCVKITPLL